MWGERGVLWLASADDVAAGIQVGVYVCVCCLKAKRVMQCSSGFIRDFDSHMKVTYTCSAFMGFRGSGMRQSISVLFDHALGAFV